MYMSFIWSLVLKIMVMKLQLRGQLFNIGKLLLYWATSKYNPKLQKNCTQITLHQRNTSKNCARL